MGTSNKGVEKEQQLKDLARQIRASHEGCLEGFRTGLGHARTAGMLLIQAKALVRRGRWQAWVDEYCAFDLRMAQNYMQIAEHHDAVVDRLGDGTLFTMTDALAIIREGKGTGGERGVGGSRTPPEFPLPAGGFEQVRSELERTAADARPAIEHDAKLTRFLDERLEAVYASVRRFVAKELSHLTREGLDAGHVALVAIELLRDRLDAAQLFAPPRPSAAGPQVAPTSEAPVEPDLAPAEPVEVSIEPDLAPTEPVKESTEPVKLSTEPIKESTEPVKLSIEPDLAPAEPDPEPVIAATPATHHERHRKNGKRELETAGI